MISLTSEQNSTLETLWSTVEPADLVQKAYPDLVNSYLDAINAKTKKSSKRAKAKAQEALVTDKDKENDKPVKAKKKSKPKEDGKTKQIDEYFKKVKNVPPTVTPKSKPKTQNPSKNNPSTQSPKIETCSTPMGLVELSFDFNDSSDAIHDLSDIIRGIVETSPTITNICGKKLHYDGGNKQPEQFQSTPNVDKDETTDEFDMIVAGMKPLPRDNITPKTSRKNKKRPSNAISKSQDENNSSPSTTPIIIKKFFKRNQIKHKTFASIPTVSCESPSGSSTPTASIQSSPTKLVSSTPAHSPDSSARRNESFKSISSPKNVKEVSYFFGDITEENDIFEKLTDFRNMDDESNDDDDSENAVSQGDQLQDINDSPPIELSDTFDLNDYVPVGANLRKRIAS